MTLFQSFLLGIVQGLTEFIPVSSTAHLLLTEYLFGWQIPEKQAFSFNILVQLGTLLALIVFFWPDLWQIARRAVLAVWNRQFFADQHFRLAWYLVLGTLPAVAAGIIAKDWVEQFFRNPGIAATLRLLVTVALLFTAERFGRRKRNLDELNWKDALIIGCFQSLSVFPGASRSGSTITGGMLRQFDRQPAARFAFLLSIPVMLGAGVYEAVDLFKLPDLVAFLPQLALGFVTAAVVGYLAIRWLLTFLGRRPLNVFAFYCAALSITVALTLIW